MTIDPTAMNNGFGRDQPSPPTRQKQPTHGAIVNGKFPAIGYLTQLVHRPDQQTQENTSNPTPTMVIDARTAPSGAGLFTTTT